MSYKVKHWWCVCRGKAKIERPVVSFWEEANLIQAEEEEIHLVREFKERLSYNLQQVSHAVKSPTSASACEAWLNCTLSDHE